MSAAPTPSSASSGPKSNRPSTPPNAPGNEVSTHGTTPILKRRAGSHQHSVEHAETAKDQYPKLWEDMENQITGPLPPRVWLDEFLPCERPRPAEVAIAWDSAAVKSEDGFKKAFYKANTAHGGAFSSLSVVDTHKNGASGYDTIERRNADLNFYKHPPGAAAPTVTDWNKAAVFCDRKPDAHDIATDPPASATPEEKQKHVFDIAPNQKGLEAKGQFISYAMQIFRSQPRLFCFSLLLMETKARFIRWDRSGGVVSEHFDWINTDILTEFLWRVNHASDEALGLDPTVSKASEEEAKDARDKLQKWADAHPGFMSREVEDKSMWKVQVFDDVRTIDDDTQKAKDGDPKEASGKVKEEKPSTPRTFITDRHHFASHSLTGRATSGYYGVELLSHSEPGSKVQLGDVVFLKDSWRIAEEGIEKEGDIYATLEKAKVPFIAKVACAGDVWSGHQKHATRTPEFAYWTEEHPWICGSPTVASPDGGARLKIIHHIHYRIVFSTIGKPLSSFSSTNELCTAIYCAIIAHGKALVIAKFLHRDISNGNILITPLGPILSDWDLSRKTTLTLSARRTWRTGTWQFMSISLLKKCKDKTYNQTERDDYESFLWVLLYNVLRYRPTVVKGPSLQELVYEIFDSQKVDFTGGDYKLNFLLGFKFTKVEVDDSDFPQPLKRIIEALRSVFKPLYPADPRHLLDPRDLAALKDAEALLSSNTYLLKVFKENLDLEWPSDDKAIDQIPQAGKFKLTLNQQKQSAVSSGTKRSSEVMEAESDTSSSNNAAPVPSRNKRQKKSRGGSTASHRSSPSLLVPLQEEEHADS